MDGSVATGGMGRARNDGPPDGSGRMRRSRLADQAGAISHRWGIMIGWAILVGVFSILRPATFPTWANFGSTIFGSQAVLVVLSIGLLIPLTAGEYDLSVTGSLGMGLILTEYLTATQGWPLTAAIIAALATGVAVGLVNAFLIVVIGVESIIATLGMGTLLIGLGYAISNQTLVGTSKFLTNVTANQVLGVPGAFFYGLGATIIAWYVYAKTPLGRYLYFVGAGRTVARLSGVRVDLLRTGSLVAAGFLGALSGVVLAGTLGSSGPDIAASYLLPAFAAVFLGSTCVTPGRFNPWGTFIAVYFLITGIIGLELMGLYGWIEDVFYGGSLIVAVSLSRLASRRASDLR